MVVREAVVKTQISSTTSEHALLRASLRRAARVTVAALVFGVAAPAAAYCFEESGREFGIDPLLLHAIAKVESSMRPRAVNHNRNGTYDIGLMQINSIHLPGLAREGYTRERLLNEPCASVRVGARILADFIAQHGYTWNAVGAYNAGSAPQREELRKRYATRVWRQYREIKRSRANMHVERTDTSRNADF